MPGCVNTPLKHHARYVKRRSHEGAWPHKVALFTGFATVKAVLSGDTVVLVGNAKPGQRPAEFQLSLASLKAPHVSRHPNATDEEFGWASREFLRKIVIGHPVKFKVEYSNDKGRKFGAIWLHNPSSEQPGDNLAIVVAANGFANVIPEEASKYGVSSVSVPAC